MTDAQAIRNWHGTGDGYGYLWWNITLDSARGPLDGFFASGWGGQHIVVIRELRLMVVLTGAYYEGPPPGLDFEGIVETWVLPAVSPGE